VIEAAMNSAEARISFSPFTLVSRLVESTHMSSGIMQMRINVMEFGRFTRKDRCGSYPIGDTLIILQRDS
jgi:ribosomal protein S28E/S33